MNRSLITTIAFFLAVVGCTAGCANQTTPPAPPDSNQYSIVASANPERKGPFIFHHAPGLRGKLGIFDSAMIQLSPFHQVDKQSFGRANRMPGKSTWFEHEKEFYTDLMKGQQYDVLVVPFQTQWDGVDRAGRMLMTYRLAAEIEAKTGMDVAPLPLVYPALGSHARFLDDDLVYSLANRLKVSSIVWGYAGVMKGKKQKQQHVRISIIKQSGRTFSKASPSEIFRCKTVPITPAVLPSEVFEQQMDQVMRFLLNIEDYAPPLKRKGLTTHLLPVPESAGQILGTNSLLAIQNSFYLQLLGMFTPESCTYQHEYFFVRSLAVLSHIDSDAPGVRLLKARAYHYLYRRPAAEKLLQHPLTPEERALRQFIDGNLTALVKTVSTLKPSITALMSRIEQYRLAESYGRVVDEETKLALAERYPGWFDLLLRRLNDGDLWQRQSIEPLKRVLDKVAPVDGYRLEDILGAAVSTGSLYDSYSGLDMMIYEHVRKALRVYAHEFAGMKHETGPGRIDLLMMGDSIGIDHLMAQVRFLNYIQGRHEQALEYCNKLLHTFKGHPGFTMLKVRAMDKIVGNLQGVEKENVISDIWQLSKSVLFWSGGQDWTFGDANYYLFQYHEKMHAPRQYISQFDRTINSDYPPRPYYRRHLNLYPPKDLIQWCHSDISDLKKLFNGLMAKHRFDQADQLLARYAGRFEGNPWKAHLQADLFKKKDDMEGLKQFLQDQINTGSQDWSIYQRLARRYIRAADYDGAATVYQRFPLLKDTKKVHVVQRSNWSFHAGDDLFWKGAWKQALPFLQYSADLDTGGGASIASQAYLFILGGQLEAAARTFLRHARRYNDAKAFAYTPYMSILHMMGKSDAAWPLFGYLIGRYRTPFIWDSAWVGHRIQGTNKEDLKQWIRKIAAGNKTSRQRSFPARFALMCLVDRAPDFDMARFVGSVDDLAAYQFSHVDNFKGPQGEAIGPGRIGIPLSKSISELMKNPPTSIYGEFAYAYEFMKEKQYEKAYRVLLDMSRYYSFRLDWMTHCFQSYYVWAAMKAEHRVEVERFLTKLEIAKSGLNHLKPKDFDAALSSAAYCAALGRHDAALKHIKTAFAMTFTTGKRHFPMWYQVVEMAIWLYEDSDYGLYRQLAVQYAKAHQAIQPWYAWAYAVQARYGVDTKDRIKALAMTQFLDPQSEMISPLSESMKKQALAWYNSHQRIHPHRSDQGPGI